jgi:hypothetical protein
MLITIGNALSARSEEYSPQRHKEHKEDKIKCASASRRLPVMTRPLAYLSSVFFVPLVPLW